MQQATVLVTLILYLLLLIWILKMLINAHNIITKKFLSLFILVFIWLVYLHVDKLPCYSWIQCH